MKKALERGSRFFQPDGKAERLKRTYIGHLHDILRILLVAKQPLS